MTSPLPGRGSQLDPAIKAALLGADSARRARIALAVARRASQLDDRLTGRSAGGVQEILAGRSDQHLRDQVARVTHDLDRRYLDVHDDRVGPESPDWEVPLRRARAAAVVYAASDPDSPVAATEATYEALYALDEGLQAVLAVVESAC